MWILFQDELEFFFTEMSPRSFVSWEYFLLAFSERSKMLFGVPNVQNQAKFGRRPLRDDLAGVGYNLEGSHP